ncbi:MAG: GxxExxY protein [Candidatus Liptonbacteria bacterium]|nr:GxxExxY protein [Candidatus Liptonbacteria bacterium]
MLRSKEKVIYPELSYRIYGLCFKIHNTLGRFRNEKQYADALEKLLKDDNIPYVREFALQVSFDGEGSRRNVVDFLVDYKIVVELKAKRFLTKEDYYQLKRYLVSSNKKLGILVNFRQQALTPKRILN